MERMWNVIPAIIGPTGTICKSFRKYLAIGVKNTTSRTYGM
jgi:hypothetical protein